MEVFDKYSGKKIGAINLMSKEEIEKSILLSLTTLEHQKRTSTEQRSTYIQIIVDVLIKHRNTLVDLIVKEAGKPWFYAEGELDRCIRTAELGLNYFDTIAKKEIDVDFKGTPFSKAETKRLPVGVVFGISPFNFPLNLALHKIIPAIASGNTILIKPSPYTPLALDFLIEKINIQLPKGLVQIIHCDNELAEYIVKHSKINMVSFTGSAQVGWHIKSLIPKKKVALELGGNAAVYIDESADNLQEIAKHVALGTFLYAGQICISTQRIIIHEKIYDTFLDQLIAATKNISSGEPMENHPNGPIIDAAHLKRIQSWVDEAVQQGAKILTGGEVLDHKRNLIAPTLLENVHQEMKIWQEEVFGPVGVISKAKDFQDGFNQINESKYGLQVGIYAHSEHIIQESFLQLEAGGIIINGVPGFRRDEMPYGGIKDSGFGREGIKYAIEDMTELKLLIQ